MHSQTDPRVQQVLDDVQARFEEKIKKIKEDGSRRINDVTDSTSNPNSVEAVIDVEIDVNFKTTSIKLSIPKFSKELHKIIIDIPTVKMVTKTLSWDVPATKMETRCIAKKPVVTVSGLSVKTEMKCIYMDFPVVYQKRMEIKVDMPEFSMKKHEISFDKPVIKFEVAEIKLNLPQFHLKSISGGLQKKEEKFERIGKEMEGQVAVAKKEMDESLLSEVSDQVEIIFGDIRKQLLNERENVSKQFDEAVSKMKNTARILKENNATEELEKIENELSKLVEDYKNVLAEIDSGIEQLNQEQLNAIKGIKLN
jgi:hypothetical protein